MGKILLTCVLALVFGFGGATLASVVLTDSSAGGAQGPTGLTGAAGAAGKDGTDGVDGARGPRGLRGLPGKDGKAGKAGTSVSVPTDLGNGDCAGKSVSVITSATLDKDSRLKLTKSQLCIVTPPSPSASAQNTGSSTGTKSKKPATNDSTADANPTSDQG